MLEDNQLEAADRKGQTHRRNAEALCVALVAKALVSNVAAFSINVSKTWTTDLRMTQSEIEASI